MQTSAVVRSHEKALQLDQLGMLALNEVVDQLMEGGKGGNVYEDIGTPPNKRQRKSKSRVWNDFRKVYAGNKLKAAVCNHCNSQFTAGGTGGTSHLARHVRKCARRLMEDEKHIVINEKQLTLPCSRSASGRSIFKKDWEFDQETSRSKLARMIVLHEYPFSIVEHEGFKDFLMSLNPMFKMVSRNTIKEDCMTMFEKEKKAMRGKFASSTQWVCLAANMWTSKQALDYLSLAVHFVDEEWKLQKRLLMFRMVESPQTAVAMANLILKEVRDWNLENRITSITLDENSINDAVVDYLKESFLVRNTLFLNGKLFHVRCAGQVLNSIVQDCLKEMHAVIYNVRESVRYLKSSPSRKQKFLDLVHEVGLSYTKGLCLDVATSWNSTYHMLERAIPFKKAFISLALIDSSYRSAPSIDDWERAEIVCKLLRIFYNAMKVASGFHPSTSNLYFHEMWKVRTMLQQEASNDDRFIRSVVSEMQRKFNKYWEVTYIYLAIPVVLDPQFKMKYVEYRFTQAFGNDAHKYIATVYNATVALFGEYHVRVSSQGVNHHMQNNVAGEDPGTSRGIDTLTDWVQHISRQNTMAREAAGTSRDDIDALSDWDQHVSQQTSFQIMTELDRYLDDGIVPRKTDFDILHWWMANESKYPTLSRMARDMLATPASSFASDSVFSTAGRVLTDFRSSLSSDAVEALVCAQGWIRAGRSVGMGTINDLEVNLSNLEI